LERSDLCFKGIIYRPGTRGFYIMIKSSADLKKYFERTDNDLNILVSSKLKYKRWQIPKKSGGSRNLISPPKPLKIFQSEIEKFLSPYVDTIIARGGIKKQNRVKAAEYIRKSNLIIKLDIKDCYPSIKKSKIIQKLQSLSFSHKYAVFFAETITLDNCLPQGSPCSLCIANLVLNELDHSIIQSLPPNTKCFRWVDDIIIGLDKNVTKEEAENLISKIKSLFQSFRYEIKDGMTLTPISREHANDILGLSISRKINVNKKWYREFRSQLDHLRNNPLPTKKELNSVKGKLATLQQVTKNHKNKPRVQKIRGIIKEIELTNK